jgi:flagellar hook-basal body complex protein FliE
MSGNISNINSLIPGLQQKTQINQPAEQTGSKPDFTEVFGNLINSVNSLQMDAAKAQELLATGDADDLHQVMIAVEKSGIAMDLLLEIRNRLVDAYQTLMRMPM